MFKNTAVKWDVSFNIAYNTNKIEKVAIGEGEPWFYKSLPSPGQLGDAYVFQEGGSIGDFYGFRCSRIDNEGNWVFLNKDGEEVGKDEITKEDKATIGNGMPKYNGGLTNRVSYKGFDLEVFFRGAFGYDILNVGRMYYENLTKVNEYNVYKSTFENGLKEASVYSDYYLEDGSYIKLENITLGYAFDVSKVDFLSSARLYLSCQNVFTFTNYSGLSPEVGRMTGDANDTKMEAGYDDLSFYPQTRLFTVGAIIKF